MTFLYWLEGVGYREAVRPHPVPESLLPGAGKWELYTQEVIHGDRIAFAVFENRAGMSVGHPKATRGLAISDARAELKRGDIDGAVAGHLAARAEAAPTETQEKAS